jgi:hypothetical protein
VYLIFALIDLFAFSPITRSEYSDNVRAIREADREDAVPDPAEAEETRLVFAVHQILGDYAARVRERQLCLCECDAMLKLILAILGGIPIESRHHP